MKPAGSLVGGKSGYTGCNCLCTSLLPWGDEWRLVGRRGEVRVAVGGSFRSNNAEMLRAAAVDGVGIAVLPSGAVSEPLRTGGRL